MTTKGPSERTGANRGAWIAGGAVVAAIVVAAAIIIGLNVGGQPGVSAQPTLSSPASQSPEFTDSSSPNATATPTPRPAAPDLAWERLDGALPAEASVYGVMNVSGRWFATGQIGHAPAIWSSDDDVPRTWTTTTVNTQRAANENAVVAQIVPAGNNLVANGWWGLADSDQFARVDWISTDGGSTWDETRTQDPALRTVVEGGPGLIGAGWASGGTTPFDSFIATSSDGVSWARINPAGLVSSEVVDLAAIGDRLVAVGGVFVDGGINVAAWYSDDGGSTWTAGDTAGGAGTLNDVTQLGQGLVAVGGAGVPTAWTTDDGITWTAHPIRDAGFAMAVAAMESGGGVVLGNDGPQDIGPEHAWSSLDGVTWIDGGDMPPAQSRMLAAGSFGSAAVAGGACLGGVTCPTPLWLGTSRK